MSEYTFGKPYIVNNWYVFPNSTLADLNINDCANSITGKCEKTDTLQQCVNLCEKDNNCISGYFIETPDKENICVPIHNTTQDFETYVKLLHNIRNKNIFPILKDMKSYIFTTSDYNYPPNNINNLLYIDNITIENINTHKSISLGNNNNNIVMSSNPTYIRLLPYQTEKNPLMIRNGDSIVISIPNSTYVLRDVNNSLQWTSSILSNITEDSTLKIFTSDKNKKIGDFLTYSDILYFTYKENPIIYDTDNNSLVIQSMNIDNAISSNKNILFKISPKVTAYTCNKQTCEPVELNTTNTSHYRSPSCWNLCNTEKKTKNKIIIIIILLFLIILLKYMFFN